MPSLRIPRRSSRNLTPDEIIKEKRAVVISGILLFLIAVLTFALPEDILDRKQYLKRAIDHAESWVPSIGRTGKLSTFPQVAQAVYTMELMTIPFLAVVYIRSFKYGDIRNEKHAKLRAIVAPVIFLSIIAGFLIYFPFDTTGHSWGSRISKNVCESRLGFIFWTSIFTFGHAVGVAVSIYWLRAYSFLVRNA